jgi:hypothetical protein
MPIYEYRCECGATLESIERVGAVREHCGELCERNMAGELCERGASERKAATPATGEGRVERLFSAGIFRGDGRETKQTVIDPCKRSNRPGGGCGDDEY